MAIQTYAPETIRLDAELVPPPPELHLAEPAEWLVFGVGTLAAPSVLATAIAIYTGWLVLWLGAVPVGVFGPGAWTGAAVRMRH